MNPQEETITIKELYVDAAKLTSSPYTLRIVVGRDENGIFSPQLVLAVSPQFALQLHQALGEALDHYCQTYAEIQLPKIPQGGNSQ